MFQNTGPTQTDTSAQVVAQEFENTWNTRNLTINGKMCILKSLALSNLVHLFSAVPEPTSVFTKLQNSCYHFAWPGKMELIGPVTCTYLGFKCWHMGIEIPGHV
jgi:hypothetical protein